MTPSSRVNEENYTGFFSLPNKISIKCYVLLVRLRLHFRSRQLRTLATPFGRDPTTCMLHYLVSSAVVYTCRWSYSFYCVCWYPLILLVGFCWFWSFLFVYFRPATTLLEIAASVHSTTPEWFPVLLYLSDHRCHPLGICYNLRRERWPRVVIIGSMQTLGRVGFMFISPEMEDFISLGSTGKRA